MNQWKNTDTVIDWFKEEKKNLYKFENFDIKEFYLSIKECLLINTVHFAEQHTKISKKDKAIISHTSKSLLFNGQHGYDHQLTYQKSIHNKNEETKNCKRKII